MVDKWDGEVVDTMISQHLLQPDLPHSLAFVGSIFTNKPAWKHGEEKGKCEEIYCCRDVDVTMQVYKQLAPMLKQENLSDLYKYIAVPLGKICKLMTDTGFAIDPSRIDMLRDKFKAEMKSLEKMIPKHLRTFYETKRRRKPAPEGTLSEKTGKPVKFIMEPYRVPVVPWRSNKTIEKYLYTELELPVQKHAKTERVTTDKQALDRLSKLLLKKEADRPKWEALNSIRKLRRLDELVSTFVKQEMSDVQRIHPSFNVHGTASGRLSSSGPNIQNIPAAARYIYVPSNKDWKIVDVDYSQIENRLTAHFAGDTDRLARFQNDPDFSEHKFAASTFFNIPYEEVEKDNDKDAPYGKAKRIVHGVNYGMGPRKLCNMYDMDFREVKKLISTWKDTIKPTTWWQERTADEAYKKGFLTTPFARKRWFYTQSYFTESLSFIPQSAAADVIFKAMIALMYKRIGWSEENVRHVADIYIPLPEPARLLIQVHDSLVFEAPAEMVDELVATVRKVMEQPWKELGGMTVPIGIEVGDSWGECKKYVKED